MAKLTYNELKAGIIFTKEGDSDPYQVLEYAFVRMQQSKPVAQLKIKNLISGKVLAYTAHQNENFEEAEIERKDIIFIYCAKDQYWFHELGNPRNRFSLAHETLGDQSRFLKEGLQITALEFDGNAIGIELPVKLDLLVAEAPPTIKGNTAQGGTKPVVLETGVRVSVPLFIHQGDVVRVNTQTGEYVERVEKN